MNLAWRHRVQSTAIPTQQTAAASVVLGALGLAILADNVLISLTATTIVFLAAFWNPVTTVLVVPAVLGFGFHTVSFGGPELSPAELVIVATVFGIAARQPFVLANSGRHALRRGVGQLWRELHSGFAPIALALILVGVVSLFTLADPSYRRESLREFRWVIVEPVVFYFLVRWYLRDQTHRRLSALLFAGGASVVAVIALFDLLAGTGLSVEGVTRVSGTYPHPNALALFLERAFVFVVVLAFAFWNNVRPGWFALATAIGMTLLFSFSRGAIAAVGLVAVIALAAGQRRRLALFAAIAGIAIVGVLLLTATERIGSLFDGGSGSLRMSIWSSSLAMARDYPLFGVGLDQFLYQYAPRYVQPEAWPERFTSHPHNILLDVWLRLGIMGIGVAIAYMVTFVRKARHAVFGRNVLGLAAAAAISVGIAHGLVDNGYFLPDLALTFWFMTALLDCESRSTASKNEDRD